MLETFKIYTHKEISLQDSIIKLVDLGYKRQASVSEEGDFTLHGDILEIFPVNFGFPVRIEWEFDTVKKIYSFDVALNKKMVDYDFLIIIPQLLSGKKLHKYSEELPLNAVLRIKKGDYVVHIHYGIGKFLGLKKLKTKKLEGYFFAIEYANKDRLYLPREDAHFIQKYVSFYSRPPSLTHLGSGEWSRIKARAQAGIKNFAWEILKMEAQRKFLGGFKYSPDAEWQKLFEGSFSYQETPDQLKATQDVKRDMSSVRCMDRLICGDVGYGKTEVAMRAAFKAIMDDKQVAFLVPTTILAAQHYQNLIDRLTDFPLKVEMLSRFRTPRQQNKIIEELKSGKIDIVVGTHRLLSKDVGFHDLGLLIIDEEQRFGVAHKERMKQLKSGIDVLILTATPIPRTLYMSMAGIKDISLVKTPPQDRLAVKTRIMEFNLIRIKEIIMAEIKRSGQIFFIHNRVETINKIYKKLRNHMTKPDTIIYIIYFPISSKK